MCGLGSAAKVAGGRAVLGGRKPGSGKGPGGGRMELPAGTMVALCNGPRGGRARAGKRAGTACGTWPQYGFYKAGLMRVTQARVAAGKVNW